MSEELPLEPRSEGSSHGFWQGSSCEKWRRRARRFNLPCRPGRATTGLDPRMTVLSIDGIGAYDHVCRSAMLVRTILWTEKTTESETDCVRSSTWVSSTHTPRISTSKIRLTHESSIGLRLWEMGSREVLFVGGGRGRGSGTQRGGRKKAPKGRNDVHPFRQKKGGEV